MRRSPFVGGLNDVIQNNVSADLQMVMIITLDQHAPRQRVATYVEKLVGASEVSALSELEGSADLMLEAVLPSLCAYHDFVATYIDTWRRFISKLETYFVCRRHVRETPDNDVIWAQGRGGVRPISLGRVDCVTAEGDYVRLMVDGDAVMVHATLQSIGDRLPASDFVQIHRSTIVRRASIRRLVRCGRRWQVEMPDHSTHYIAKARVAELSGEIESGRNNRMVSGSSIPVPVSEPV